MPSSCCKVKACIVTAAVTLGLPSRSPPVHVPNRSGTASTGSSTPNRVNTAARSLSTAGTATRAASSRWNMTLRASSIGSGRSLRSSSVSQSKSIISASSRCPLDDVRPGKSAASAASASRVGHRPQLGQRRSARRFGRVSGEHRPHVELAGDLLELDLPTPRSAIARAVRSSQPPSSARSRRSSRHGGPARRRWRGGSRRRTRGRAGPRQESRRSAGARRPPLDRRG